ncbi:replicative DNA helicase [Maridesulfovibrio ferrireducens]|uniref:Replicative DNA helicase n=1 Tax=Maridesulfovibrio ferrireducens TaxID=246191 RepID=A0A1G9HYU3_9BACT|nr:replicative DNA helicase [Maridesulfovibrio ferrireducens]MBI9111346.1 replicative DNA helicase [Maridesulfovibrio ferrireducens]SDL18139.1 replicative DNA helicase [Maridesulfovibrio ferrireducens]
MQNQKQKRRKPGSNYNSDGASSDAPSDLLRKVPPHNLEAEQAVLGGVFLSNSIFNDLVDIVHSDDFYSPSHHEIFKAFEALYAKNAPIDIVTVNEYLTSTGKIDTVGGPVYLADLANSVISAANALHHAEIVAEKKIQRSLIDAAASIITDSFEAQNVKELLDHSEQAIFEITDAKKTTTIKSSKELIKEVFKELEIRVEQKSLVTGIPTTYTKFDEMTAGLQNSELVIIAGRPSMGKTAFALNVAMRAALHSGVPTAVFSLEMAMGQLMTRMLACHGKVDLSRLRTGQLDDEDWAKLYEAAQDLTEAPIFIDDTPSLSTMELRARCRRLKSQHNLGLVMVDYLQLMRSSARTDSREQEISDISRSLKALAKELKIPVLALSQLNRKVEERTDKRPMMSDLRESGAIEQDADIILFLYREDFYNKKEDKPINNKAEVIIGKQRNGPTGIVELAFFGNYTAFENLAAEPYPSEYGDD